MTSAPRMTKAQGRCYGRCYGRCGWKAPIARGISHGDAYTLIWLDQLTGLRNG